MVTGELKSKIDSLWEIFWTGGLTNPLDVIEQMTYLMFIHDLDESDNTHAKEAAMLGLPYKSIFAGEVQVGERTVDGVQLKWSVFHDFPAGKMYSTMQEMVFPFIKNLHGDKDSAYAKYMGDAIFKVPTPLMLDKIVTAMDGMYEQMAKESASDIAGDVYEYLLSKLENGRGSSRTTPSGRLTDWNVSSRCPAKSPPSFKRSPLSCRPCGNRAKKSRRSQKRKLRPAGMPSGKPRATLARGFLFPEIVRGPPG